MLIVSKFRDYYDTAIAFGVDKTKVKDPFTAFQDIMQYISGVLGVGEPNTVDISNEMMRDKKGFDDWSFKTHPDDSKKPRKRGR